MPKLIKDGEVLDNPWVIIDKESPLSEALTHGDHLIVPARLWISDKSELLKASPEIGVWLDSDEGPAMLENDLDDLNLVALNFPMFMDGRAYSSAAILRQQYKFKGDIRAIGDVLRDQLSYMRSCGFSSFLLSDSVKLEDAFRAFNDFKDQYQSTVIKPTPLFRRR